MDSGSEATHESTRYRRKAIPLSWARRILAGQQKQLYDQYRTLFPPRESDLVLDLGVNGSLERPELHFFEWSYPFRSRIVAAGLEPPDLFHTCFPEVRYVQVGRSGALPFADDEFDIVFSNAVVEHVGDRESQRRFLEEVARVGRAAFVTTPNRWFPVELHTVLPFVHWLPTRWYRAIFRGLGFSFFADERNLNLLDRRSLRALVPPGLKARIVRRRLFGWTSNLLLVWRKASTPAADEP